MADQNALANKFAAAVAKVIRDEEERHLLKHLEATTFDAEQFQAFFISLRAESDRALAIVSFSYVDVKLRDLMLQAFNPRTPVSLERLFEPLGPLATASARIKLAGALNWLAPPVFQNLELHRKIRNEFAHHPFLSGFAEPRIACLVNEMLHYETHFVHLLEEKAVDPASLGTRFLFHLRTMMTCYQMVAELIVAPLALRFGMEPLRFLDSTSGKQPTVLRDLATASGMVLADLIESQVKGTSSGDGA